MKKPDLWKRYQKHLCVSPPIGLRLDISRMMFDESYLDGVSGPMTRALAAMDRLEHGAKANLDEDRT